MSEGRIHDDRFLAQCCRCGTWREVRPEAAQADLYFEYWRARFSCCGQEQAAWFTVAKEDDDVH